MPTAIPEPSSPLWQRVKSFVEWPLTNEATVSALAADWRRAGHTFVAACRHNVGSVKAAWSDDVGTAFVDRASTTLAATGMQAKGMTTLGNRTDAFATEVTRVKTDITNHVAANDALYNSLQDLPFGMAAPAQDWFVTQVAVDVNQIINDGADRVSAMGDGPDEDRLIEIPGGPIGELAGEVGSWVGDRAADLARVPGEVGSWIGDRAADLGELVGGEDRLEAAANRDVDVDAIAPEPVWRESDEPLYRSDYRAPDEIFRDGLKPWNTDNVDLEGYVFTNERSAFVATTTNEELYQQGGWGKRDYRYTIDAPGGIDIVSTLPEVQNVHPGQDEIAFPGGVDTRYIQGVHRVNTDGTLGEWIPNPNYEPD